MQIEDAHGCVERTRSTCLSLRVMRHRRTAHVAASAARRTLIYVNAAPGRAAYLAHRIDRMPAVAQQTATSSGDLMKSLPVLRHSALALLALALAGCGAADAPESSTAAADTAPAATVTEPAAAEPAAEPVAVAAGAADAGGIGEETYQKTCAVCHATTALGAPVLGSKEQWAPRIAQGQDVLHTHAIEGYVGESGAMPARGGNPSLDDDTVKAAVDYMVSKAQ